MELSPNEMLRDEISKIDYNLVPVGFRGDAQRVRAVQESLSAIINKLGVQSATTQCLDKVITTAEKLRSSPSYKLYLLKDAEANGGKGEVIGMLKVGQKHLFLFDETKQVRETDPMCVLDFYVAGERQRNGYGRKLFDYMLQDLKTSPHLLAVDGPSSKMEKFLLKTYGIDHLLRQSNNFAVSPRFFEDIESVRVSASPPVSSPVVGRFTAPRPQSNIANVIHGCLDVENGYRKNGETSEVTPEEAPVSEPVPTPTPEPAGAEPRAPERPSTLHVDTAPQAIPLPPAAAPSPAAPSPAGSTMSRRDSQLTDKGFFDVKFYHNKLW